MYLVIDLLYYFTYILYFIKLPSYCYFQINFTSHSLSLIRWKLTLKTIRVYRHTYVNRQGSKILRFVFSYSVFLVV